MITMQRWMELVSYRITETDRYGWTCYGNNAHTFSSWNGIHDEGGWSSSMVFDTANQTVYEVEICDYTNNRAYRIINPNFKQSYDRAVDALTEGGIPDVDLAWDDVRWIDLELDEDFLEKAKAIISDVPYDTRVQIPLDLEDSVMLQLFKLAHEQDVTFNQFVEKLLQEEISKQNDYLASKNNSRT